MSYPAMTRNLKGVQQSATGTVTFKQQQVGFFDGGEAIQSVYVADTPLKSFQVTLGGAATVVIEGNDWDGDQSGSWYSISSTTSSTAIKLEQESKFLRARVSAYTNGTVDVSMISFG